VEFDRWFYEHDLKEAIDPIGQWQNEPTPDSVYEEVVNKGLTYKKDGAIYFKASEFGDSEDRVLKTSAGRYTYIVADIAYHLRKQRHSDQAVNLLGPDHHGHILQLKSALKALLGDKADFFHPIIIQQVNLKRDGKPIKVSKRAGVGVTLDDLIEEVGVDASRFYFLMRRTSSSLDFDLELAKKHTEENPVYYVQYAHARIRSILRHPDALQYFGEQGVSYDKKPTLIEWNDEFDLSLLVEKEELNLLRIMARFPWTLRAVVRAIDPQPLTTYLIDLAKAFHLFYAHCRVIGDSKALSTARLILCLGVISVLKEGLELVGVQAPSQMSQ
jgi:arginyl-tRNA synthetase